MSHFTALLRSINLSICILPVFSLCNCTYLYTHKHTKPLCISYILFFCDSFSSNNMPWKSFQVSMYRSNVFFLTDIQYSIEWAISCWTIALFTNSCAGSKFSDYCPSPFLPTPPIRPPTKPCSTHHMDIFNLNAGLYIFPVKFHLADFGSSS